MKITGILIFFFFVTIVLTAQQISNLNFETVGKNIQIRYDLDGKINEEYKVTLFASQNEGSWDGPLRYVSGEVGENIKAGKGKLISWEVLKEKEKLTGNLKFKIEVQLLFSCKPFTVTHTAGLVAPFTKKVTYGTVLTDLSGSKKCWITQNLGANGQAISATDDTEASAGWYWQFNRKQGHKHDGVNRTPNNVWISGIDENSDWLLANDPCNLLLGNVWRLPTYSEWNNASSTIDWKSYNETFTSVLKLHAAGDLSRDNAFLTFRGYVGYYWSSSQLSSDNGWSFHFHSRYSAMSGQFKASGFTARCLRD